MLNAAEEVVLRDGIGCLTIDAVAKEAHLSKSGLLHHFPNKEALIDALVRRKIDGWKSDTAANFAKQPKGTGRAVRSIMSTCLASTDKWTDAMRRSSVVLVAALVHDSKHVEPLRQAHREMIAMFAADALSPGVSDTVHLAVHGLWFDWIFGLSDWTPERLASVRAALELLIATAAPASKIARSAARAARRQRTTSSKPRVGKPRR